MPKVSIIMPVYNGEKYLKSAVKSVLDQSFQDYEFIVIDDGSNDCTRSILLGCKDNRIKLIRNITHRGISFALNQGLSLASGELIMRMDADDICAPQRILKQVHFMDQHTDIDVCGSDTELIDENGKVIGYRNTKKGDQQIKIALLLGECSLAHPAVVVRRAFLTKNMLRYSYNYVHAEDYELWCRSSVLGTFENISEPLIQYRRHQGSVSKKHLQAQRISARRILKDHLDRMGIIASPAELECHMQLALKLENDPYPLTSEFCSMWQKKLLLWNQNCKCFQQDLFEYEVNERFQKVFIDGGILL